MSDGEVMERLWSYLKPTSKITKEMTPAHRADTLTDFLMHYARKPISSFSYMFLENSTVQSLYTLGCGYIQCSFW